MSANILHIPFTNKYLLSFDIKRINLARSIEQTELSLIEFKNVMSVNLSNILAKSL